MSTDALVIEIRAYCKREFPNLTLSLRKCYGSRKAKLACPVTGDVLVEDGSNHTFWDRIHNSEIKKRLKAYKPPQGFGLTNPAEDRKRGNIDKLTRRLNDLAGIAEESLGGDDIDIGKDRNGVFYFSLDGVRIRG